MPSALGTLQDLPLPSGMQPAERFHPPHTRSRGPKPTPANAEKRDFNTFPGFTARVTLTHRGNASLVKEKTHRREHLLKITPESFISLKHFVIY